MCPVRIGAPSTAFAAGRGPARLRKSGRMPKLRSETCRVINTAAGNLAGSVPTSFWSASKPPAEAPITMMSRAAILTQMQFLNARIDSMW